MGPEHRTSTRHRVKLPVSCEINGKSIPMTAANISRGGMMLVAPEILKVGTMAKLKFALNDCGVIEVKGMVRHSVVEGGCGVEFVEIHQADQERLAEYLEKSQAAAAAATS